MNSKVEAKCKCCGSLFIARSADIKRGWAKACSKSCAATLRERRTGAYRRYINRNDLEENEFDDAHLFSNEDHDCNKDY